MLRACLVLSTKLFLQALEVVVDFACLETRGAQCSNGKEKRLSNDMDVVLESVQNNNSRFI